MAQIRVQFYMASAPMGSNGITGTVALIVKDEDQAAELVKIALYNNATNITVNR